MMLCNSTVLIYDYLCPTCGLKIGPYSYGHKLIECGNCPTGVNPDGLLVPVLREVRVLPDRELPLTPKVIRKGVIWNDV